MSIQIHTKKMFINSKFTANHTVRVSTWYPISVSLVLYLSSKNLTSFRRFAGSRILCVIFIIIANVFVHLLQELGLLGIPLPECKSIPELFFFDVVGQTNAIIHLLDKQFSDSLLPLVASTPKHADCLTKKKKELEKLEQKIDAGVDRSLNALVGWVKTILTSEQKKSDFNEGQGSTSGKVMPNAALPPTTSTAACNRVVKFVNYQVDKIRESLDGKNIEFVLYELGVRLHWVIYQHMQQFTYSSAGVMAVICDVQVISKPS